MANYFTLKNSSILTPTSSTDLGSDSNRYSNVYMSGNIVMSNGVTVTSNNVITPKISSVTYPGDDTAADTAGGQTITITGTGFSSGASVLVGSTPVNVVTVVSSTSITFTSPAVSAGNYALYVINTDGGTAIYIPGIAYSGTPTWSTSSGSLSTVYETNSINSTLSATGDGSVTYSLFSGTLPTGSTLNASTGVISGTAPASAGSTTYTFTIRATDAQNQDTNRSFSITVNSDAVTWVSPADGATTTLDQDSAMATFTMSATSAAGKSITYTANSLPTGLSISSNTIVGTPTVTGNSSSLITATASDSNRASTRTFNWVVSVASDPYFKYNTLLLNAEGAAATNNAVNNTFLDGSTNNFSVTKEGTIGQGTYSPYSIRGFSYYTPGAPYLSVPNSSGFDFGTGAYTIEAYFNMNVAVAQGTIVGLVTGFKICVISTTSLRIWADDGQTYSNVTATITPGVWYHVAWVRENYNLGKLYLDGSLIHTETSSYLTQFTPTGSNVYIGRYSDTFTNNFNGYISNVRIVKGTAVYTSNFTPSTTPLTAISGTTLLTCQSNRIQDNSSSNASISSYGSTWSIEKYTPFAGSDTYSPTTHGGSASFNGTDNAIVVSAGATGAIAFGTGDYTIECWVYATTMSDARTVFLINTGSGYSFLLRYGGTTYWQLYYPGGSKTDLIFDSTNSGLSQWTHHAIVRSSSVLKWYINGVQIYSVANTTSSSDTELRLGNYSTYWWKGYISGFRIVKGTAVYTSSFTPPTSPPTNIANTSVLLNFTNAGIIDQTGMNDIITVGDGSSKINTSVKKFGNASISFAGTGGWLEPRQPRPLLRLGAADWTFEFWLRVPNITQSAIWLVNWNTDPRLNLDNATLSWMTAGVARITTGNVLTANTWQHIAVVKYNGNTKIYVDGTQSGSTYTDSNSYTTTDMDAIGYHPFTGYIDDFRITKGYARYTANFTAPTQPHNLK